MRDHKSIADVLILLVLFCWLGYDIGRTVEKEEPRRVEYVSPKTKCVDWDFGGKDGQKRCFQWRRVS